MPLELTRLTFKACPGEPGDTSTVTILVGPNNSGKSLTLREIETWASGSDQSRVVTDELEVDWPETSEECVELLRPFETAHPRGSIAPPNSFFIVPFRVDGSQSQEWVNKDTLGPGGDPRSRRRQLLHHFTARLDGRARFSLMDPRAVQDLQLPPKHHLAALFKSDELRQRVRDIVENAFPDRYFVIDPTEMKNFRIRMSTRSPSDPDEERGWGDRSVKFHTDSDGVESLSDGMICFTGLVAATLALPHKVLLIDEPEAFLHPPLARSLGSSLASLVAERGASLVAATHSAEFLMGCIEADEDTTIVRLTFEGGKAGARSLSPSGIRALISDPLLSSTRALLGLFHRGVVVGEADSDRAFYSEINRRMTDVNRGAADTFFTSAWNWQTISRVIRPLRQLGVPAAAVLDLDAVMELKREWEKIYDAVGLERSTRETMETRRSTVAGYLKARSKSDIKTHGLTKLSPKERKVSRAFLDDLKEYGVFVVPVGELESWLSRLNVSRTKKANWIPGIFKALGSSRKGANRVAPGRGDVWAFIDEIASWISDSERKGML